MRGKEFVVLAVTVMHASDRPVMFTLYQPDNSPIDYGLHGAREFEVVGDTLPSNWVYSA